MVERIRLLLETRQLTPTQFADVIGIARPIVSHILSGRNKPSLEVVQRILAAMPELSVPWLLNGTGPMQTGTVATAPAPTPVASAPPLASPGLQVPETPVVDKPDVPVVATPKELFPVSPPAVEHPAASRGPRSVATSHPTAEPGPVPKRFKPVSSNITPTPPAGSPEPSPRIAAVPPAPSEPRTVAVAPPVKPILPLTDGNSTTTALFAGSGKPIRRIVIFYQDGSFADYQPE